MVRLTRPLKPCMFKSHKEKAMRISNAWIGFLILLLCACSTSPAWKGAALQDAKTLLKDAPRAEDHPNAGGAMMLSHAVVEYFPDGTSLTRRHERYKIFNERGRRFASKSISYRQGYQEARILFAHTIKPDGKVVALSPSDIHDTTQYGAYDFYTDIRQKRFTMPAVENGCIVDIAYEIKNLKPVLPFDYFTAFIFDHFFPIQEDILEVHVPASVSLRYKYLNISGEPVIEKTGNRIRYIFTNRNRKEIIPEPRMPGLLDRETFPQIWMWTLQDWQILSSWYGKVFFEQMKASAELEAFTLHLIAQAPSREDKIRILFDFVARKVRYVAILLGPHTHQPHSASEVFLKRYGDCKDKTVLLLTMLKIAGIEGYPALVPVQRDHFDQTMPSLSAFNHVLAVVPQKDGWFWLETTNEAAAYDTTPFMQPTTVFIISPDGSHRFDRTPPLDDRKDYITSELLFRIDPEGNALADMTHVYFGKAAEAMRYAFKYLPPEQRKILFEKKGIEVRSLEIGSVDDAQNPFRVHLTGFINNMAQRVDPDTMILSNVVRMDTFRDITASKTRLYPVVMPVSFYREETIRYVFPDGYQMRNVPNSLISGEKFHNRQVSFRFEESTLTVSIETSGSALRIATDEMDRFREYAAILQAYESSVQTMIFEKRR